MLESLSTYWFIVAPTALTGLYLLAALKKRRDQLARQPAPALIPIDNKRVQ